MLHAPPPPAATPTAAAGLAPTPIPGPRRAFSGRRMRPAPAPDAELLALGDLWRASWAREQALDAVLDAIDDTHSAAYAAAREVFFKQEKISKDLRRRIALLPAATWPGVLLKIELTSWACEIRDEDMVDELKRDAVAGGTALLFSLSRDLKAWFHPGPDEELLQLGEQFEQAWAADRSIAACFDELPEDATLSDKTRVEEREEIAAGHVKCIIGKIEALPATTLAGLAVKMRACLWCHSGEPFDRNSFGEATNMRLAGSLLRDIQTIDGRPLPMATRAPSATLAA